MRLLLLLTSAFALLSCTTSDRDGLPDGLPQVKHLIDTHIHLYDTERPEGVPWPRAHDEVLYKPHLPEEFSQVSKAAGVTGVVIVEASDRIPDNRWVLDLVEDDDHYVALVGNIDPYREDFAQHLDELKKDRRFVGIRARVSGKEIDYADEQVLSNFRLLTENNLSLDILTNGGGGEGVRRIDTLARTLPEQRIIVNHVLGYNIDGKPLSDEWLAAIRSLAENRNVWVKVSGLYQRSIPQPAPQTQEHYQPILDALWGAFGEKRLIYGSNWPCTKNTGSYESFVRVVNTYFSAKGRRASERYFWKNAAEAYNLKLQ